MRTAEHRPPPRPWPDADVCLEEWRGTIGDMVSEPTAEGFTALAEGRWAEARGAFEAALSSGETAEGCFGLAMALWWLGENQVCVERCTRAYTLFRESGLAREAARCAVWLAITYKANFANFAAAHGWLRRAERLLEPFDPTPLHGWVWIARAYRMADLDTAEDLTVRAHELARRTDDIDLELVALAQLGLIRVGKGQTEAGFELIDEAMAAALAGERSTLETVVYACCDMLNACELATDLERATQWCRIADDFVTEYGCPFLYAECRIYYGSVLAANGRWADAERELHAGLVVTEGACAGLHRRAAVRLAGLRIRQGRLEEAQQLMADLGAGMDAEAEASLLTAALCLARGDASAAERHLEQRLRHLETNRWHLANALDMLVDAAIDMGHVDTAAGAARRLAATAASSPSLYLSGLADSARGRVLLAQNIATGVTYLEAALEAWSSLDLPFEAARTRAALAAALAASEPDVAIDHSRRALRTFESMGASIDADRTAALLRGLGVVPRTGIKRPGALTGREREVLRLVAAGLSNPEIAERLHISRKTASHHVSNILSKLGLRNRAEAAAHAVAGGETLPDSTPTRVDGPDAK